MGGTTAAGRNFVVNNGQDGVSISESSATDNVVEGNWIGIGPDGSSKGNTRNGVLISDSLHNTIGGNTAGTRNVISGNNDAGVRITESSVRITARCRDTFRLNRPPAVKAVTLVVAPCPSL